jgi:hypothetical protein
LSIDAVWFSSANTFAELLVVDEAGWANWKNFLDALAELAVEDEASLADE